MKVVIVNVNSHTTSTGKIAYGLYKFLKEKGDEVRLVCRGALEQKIQDVDIISLDSKIEVYYSLFMSKLTGYEGVHNYFATVKLLRIIQIFKPDIVHLLNLPGHYVDIFTLLEFLKKNHIKTVYSMMDDYPFAGKCTFVKDCDRFISGCGDCPNLHDYPSSYFLISREKSFKEKKEYTTVSAN